MAETRSPYLTAKKTMSRDEMFRVVKDLESQMRTAARGLEFEKAALLRDEIYELRRLLVLDEKGPVPVGLTKGD